MSREFEQISATSAPASMGKNPFGDGGTKENIFEIINLQPLKNGKSKPYQVRQVRNLFLEYKFHIMEE